MRIYVGTLYTIENEFDECVQSINAQTYKDFDQFVFKNLPNKEAHMTLFQSFLDRKSEYDVLIKIDADMVLTSDTLFQNIVGKLLKNKWLDLLSIAVHDFFSNHMIWGLNAFRNSVCWNLKDENLFVDIPDVPQEKYLMDNKDLAPAAIHCKNPSPYQAFHYGVHRGLKVIQPGRREKQKTSSYYHWYILERTWKNFLATRDHRIGLASLGAELAYAGHFNIQDLDYSNHRMFYVLENYHDMDSDHLYQEIRKVRLKNMGILPGKLRWVILCRIHQ